MARGKAKAANLVYGQGLRVLFIELEGIWKTGRGLRGHINHVIRTRNPLRSIREDRYAKLLASFTFTQRICLRENLM